MAERSLGSPTASSGEPESDAEKVQQQEEEEDLMTALSLENYYPGCRGDPGSLRGVKDADKVKAGRGVIKQPIVWLVFVFVLFWRNCAYSSKPVLL